MDSPAKRRTAKQASPPDGGYGWFILLATFFSCGWLFGTLKGFGVLFVELSHYFAMTTTETTWIPSTTLSTIYIFAPISAVMSVCYSHRAVVMTGGVLAAVGMATGSVSQNHMQLIFSVGFLTGLGYALTLIPTTTMLAMYFDKRRPLAYGLASTGECIITFLITPFIQLMVDWYSWRGAMLILGALSVNLSVCGALLRPLPFTQNLPTNSKVKEMEVSSGNITMGAQLKEKVLQYIDYTLIANKQFMLYSLFGVLATFGIFVPSLYLVPYARSRGMEEYQAAALISISAACDLTGRLACSWLANLRLTKTINLLITMGLLQGLVLLFCPLTTSFTELAAFSVAYGLTIGGIVSIHNTVLVDMVGVARLGSAISITMLFRCIGSLLGPSIAGDLIDRTSDYGTGFLAAGVALIVSTFCLLPVQNLTVTV